MVSYEEGVALKVKHGLQHFCETNVFIERETQQVFFYLCGTIINDFIVVFKEIAITRFCKR